MGAKLFGHISPPISEDDHGNFADWLREVNLVFWKHEGKGKKKSLISLLGYLHSSIY